MRNQELKCKYESLRKENTHLHEQVNKHALNEISIVRLYCGLAGLDKLLRMAIMILGLAGLGKLIRIAIMILGLAGLGKLIRMAIMILGLAGLGKLVRMAIMILGQPAAQS